MIGSDVMRGYNDLMILSLLAQEDSYGYEISKKIRKKSDDTYIMKETTLYSAFTRLEKTGCIESYSGTETNGKQRTYYRITDAGRALFQQKCGEWSLVKTVVDKFIHSV